MPDANVTIAGPKEGLTGNRDNRPVPLSCMANINKPPY
jgi:hypothetical protein